MSTFYGISSDNSSSYFSSFFGNSSTSGTSGTSGSSSMLTDYYSIKNGSYKKLLRAYYAKENSSESTSKTSSVSSDDKKQLSLTKSNSESLAKSAATLLDKSSKSVFNKVSKTDAETGKTTSEYDVDKIYSAVKSFVDNYNKTIDSAEDVDTDSILKKTLWMVNETKVYENALSKVGIKIGDDNKLSIDETKFKKADMRDVKDLFNESASFGAKVFKKASDINSLSNTAINGNSLYNSSAKYSTLSSGQLFDSLL